jgi:uncharacterized protein
METAETEPFWRTKTLEEMTPSEWESVCDGCGLCCLTKLRNPDNSVDYTSVGCRLLSKENSACSDYPNRKAKVPACLKLTPSLVREMDWLPVTCGYRLLAEGQDLLPWHPLISKDPETVHTAGISTRGKHKYHQDDIPEAELNNYIIDVGYYPPKK